jgi:hypothetical protein
VPYVETKYTYGFPSGKNSAFSRKSHTIAGSLKKYVGDTIPIDSSCLIEKRYCPFFIQSVIETIASFVPADTLEATYLQLPVAEK